MILNPFQMRNLRQPLPFVRLHKSVDLVLFLICEDLKSHKLFSVIDQLDMGDCPYQSYLGKAVLAQLNMDDGSDEIFQFYDTLIEKRCRKINGDQKSLMKQAMKVYGELMGEKEGRNKR
jgi:hypothetical protein